MYHTSRPRCRKNTGRTAFPAPCPVSLPFSSDHDRFDHKDICRSCRSSGYERFLPEPVRRPSGHGNARVSDAGPLPPAPKRIPAVIFSCKGLPETPCTARCRLPQRPVARPPEEASQRARPPEEAALSERGACFRGPFLSATGKAEDRCAKGRFASPDRQEVPPFHSRCDVRVCPVLFSALRTRPDSCIASCQIFIFFSALRRILTEVPRPENGLPADRTSLLPFPPAVAAVESSPGRSRLLPFPMPLGQHGRARASFRFFPDVRPKTGGKTARRVPRFISGSAPRCKGRKTKLLCRIRKKGRRMEPVSCFIFFTI